LDVDDEKSKRTRKFSNKIITAFTDFDISHWGFKIIGLQCSNLISYTVWWYGGHFCQKAGKKL